MSFDCSRALPRSDMGLSAVCDCGYFLIILTYYSCFMLCLSILPIFADARIQSLYMIVLSRSFFVLSVRWLVVCLEHDKCCISATPLIEK